MATQAAPAGLIGEFLGLARQRELLLAWTRRDLDSRWRGTLLGPWWALVQPLFMLALYTFVFSLVLRVKFGTGDFALNLWAGLAPWMAFSETLSRATTAIVGQPNLVKKVVFPLALLPASQVLAAAVSLAIGLGLLVGAAGLTGQLHATALWLPVIMALQLAFTLGLAWGLASLGVFLRDLASAIGLVLNAWMYLSPIVYPASMVPEAYRGLYMLNPAAFWAEGTRNAVLAGVAPTPGMLAVQAAIAAVTLLLGFAWFMKTRRAFADVI
ncbi:MAG: sugar transporter permease [Cyanobacteria bacterium RYN_339]|nr:sugar transporter permease [Cyanobacteria bacterium RYN_339]